MSLPPPSCRHRNGQMVDVILISLATIGDDHCFSDEISDAMQCVPLGKFIAFRMAKRRGEYKETPQLD